MSILEIENRTENWRTAYYFAPFFRDENARSALVRELLAGHLGKQPSEVQLEADDVHINLFWVGMRDILHPRGNKNKGYYNNLVKQHKRAFAKHYMDLFPDLRNKVKEFRFQGRRFAELKTLNYAVSLGDESGMATLFSNLFYTEIDIVLETPKHLFIGEAKHESEFNTDGTILVHQLIREYVMARILVERLGYQKGVVPFVVGDDSEALNRKGQVTFMIQQGWMSKDNVLTWKQIKGLWPRP